MAPLAAGLPPARSSRLYADYWLALNVLPHLHSGELWQWPLVAAAFDAELRARMLSAADALPRLLNELDTMPQATAHGDACTRNLLVTDTNDGFAMIDFAFWGSTPIGFDLGQLLLGEIQMGERPSAALTQLEDICLPAYVDGLHAEGNQATPDQVRRSHALLMTIHHAIPAIPYEHQRAEPTPQLHRLFTERAAMARIILDLLDTTEKHAAIPQEA